MAQLLENCLNLGIINDAINFVLENDFIITNPKLMYNEWYSQPEVILQRFSSGFLETDFLVPILNKIVEDKQGQTPLEELKKLYLINNNKDGINSNLH